MARCRATTQFEASRGHSGRPSGAGRPSHPAKRRALSGTPGAGHGVESVKVLPDSRWSWGIGANEGESLQMW